MKKVKNLFLMMAMVGVALLSSCDNEGTDPVLEDEITAAAVAATAVDSAAFGNSDLTAWTEIDESELPQTVLDYILDNYPDDSIRHAWVDENGGYVVLLSGRTAVRFDSAGAFVEAVENAGRRRGEDKPELTEVALEDLPVAITDYVDTNYADYAIEKAGVDEDGNYHVKLEDGPVLIFDADGNFVEERARRDGNRERRRGRGERGHADDRWTAMDIANLPSVITDYIATNYPDASILRAGTDADGNYGVILDTEIALIFDEEGVFVEERAYHEHDGECEGTGDDGEG